MKTVYIIALFTLAVNVAAQKVPSEEMAAHTELMQNPEVQEVEYNFRTVDDPYNEWVQVVSPMLETSDHGLTLHWSISGSINRQTGSRSYHVIWTAVYTADRYRFHDLYQMRIPGPIVFNAENYRREADWRDRYYMIVELWGASISEDQLTTLDEFRINGDYLNFDCAVPPDYLAGLMDAMMEYSGE